VLLLEENVVSDSGCALLVTGNDPKLGSDTRCFLLIFFLTKNVELKTAHRRLERLHVEIS